MARAKKRTRKPAIIIGGEPATVFSAVAPVPEGLDKYLFAGIARKGQDRITGFSMSFL